MEAPDRRRRVGSRADRALGRVTRQYRCQVRDQLRLGVYREGAGGSRGERRGVNRRIADDVFPTRAGGALPGGLGDLDTPARPVQPRNVRRAAIRGFFRFVAIREPALLLHCQRVLAIPAKR